MRRYLFSQKGKFYKANLHCHTDISDGCCSPEEIKERYKEKGYSVVAFTDHACMIDHSDLNDEGFLALKGYEIDINSKERDEWNVKKTYHINLIARAQDVEAQVCFNPKSAHGRAKAYIPFIKYIGDYFEYDYSPECINRIVKEANENGFIVNYNHPAWSLQTYEDYGALEGLYGVEVYNGSGIAAATFDNNSAVYAQMLRKAPSLIPIAADDNHNSYGFEGPYCDSFRGFNMIKAESLSYSDIMAALLRGDTYASTGPLFEELYIEDGILHIKTTPVCDVAFVTMGRNGTRVRRDNGETFTECEFAIDESTSPFRIEAVDISGNRAYTRLYFV